ncbi:pimeloyl-ACP methyl ester carboxylesterase [Parvibaculum indicum]|uniref:alpha/beta fold hydrolase n=1 Tax=Parvibaculum indicum TaxID=562969 RepID=UPI0014216B58|nr:alpha/beta hydrolase [Parvibaculum indicum]NIJ40878.1 pimeloyl-ACP methyl ester carboxylesterase [Parvibaculum indicum]
MEERIGPASHIYFSQRLRLHYVDWGNENASPMLMIHGGRDHCRNWDWTAQALRNDYHIIAPDLRGHGDSDWMLGSTYQMNDYVYDIAQLIHQKDLAPLTIVAHSMGGAVALRYTGLYPENVKKLVVIEGLGPSPKMLEKGKDVTTDQRIRNWIDETRKLSGRQPRRYASIEEAYKRMQDENPHLSPERARHLTIHGVHQNEDGTYSWKFDNYVRVFPPTGFDEETTTYLWSRITCPTLLIRGTESWASDPVKDGRAKHFQNAEVVNIEGAGHWVQHDKLDEFLSVTRDFLKD